jgi:dienelactone hydrolase
MLKTTTLPLFILTLLNITACTQKVPRYELSIDTKPAGWQYLQIPTSDFELVALLQEDGAVTDSTLRVVIEGDGLAWLSRTRPSLDPTPVTPTGLYIAQASNAAYLARPCQYQKVGNCSIEAWTKGRFSRQVIANMNEALNTLKKKSGAESFELIGFSGGAAVAALVSDLRNDIKQITTFSGNLEPHWWTDYHNYSLLDVAQSPLEVLKSNKSVRQHHYFGTADTVIPVPLFKRFIANFSAEEHIEVTVVKGCDHQSCWAALIENELKKRRSNTGLP